MDSVSKMSLAASPSKAKIDRGKGQASGATQAHAMALPPVAQLALDVMPRQEHVESRSFSLSAQEVGHAAVHAAKLANPAQEQEQEQYALGQSAEGPPPFNDTLARALALDDNSDNDAAGGADSYPVHSSLPRPDALPTAMEEHRGRARWRAGLSSPYQTHDRLTGLRYLPDPDPHPTRAFATEPTPSPRATPTPTPTPRPPPGSPSRSQRRLPVLDNPVLLRPMQGDRSAPPALPLDQFGPTTAAERLEQMRSEQEAINHVTDVEWLPELLFYFHSELGRLQATHDAVGPDLRTIELCATVMRRLINKVEPGMGSALARILDGYTTYLKKKAGEATEQQLARNRILKAHTVVPSSDLEDIKRTIQEDRETIRTFELANRALEDGLAHDTPDLPVQEEDVDKAVRDFDRLWQHELATEHAVEAQIREIQEKIVDVEDQIVELAESRQASTVPVAVADWLRSQTADTEASLNRVSKVTELLGYDISMLEDQFQHGVNATKNLVAISDKVTNGTMEIAGLIADVHEAQDALQTSRSALDALQYTPTAHTPTQEEESG